MFHGLAPSIISTSTSPRSSLKLFCRLLQLGNMETEQSTVGITIWICPTVMKAVTVHTQFRSAQTSGSLIWRGRTCQLGHRFPNGTQHDLSFFSHNVNFYIV